MTFLALRSRMTLRARHLPTRTALALLTIGAMSMAQDAAAFSVSSAVSKPCHETITEDALRHVRLQRPAALPLASDDRNDRALIDDVPFKVDEDMQDMGAVTLLLGIRDNDLKGRGPNEVDSLAQIHGSPTGQHEHCLRSPTQDEPNGTPDALKECRAFIREMIADALEGLDESGRPSLLKRIPLEVTLSLRGRVDTLVPRYYLRMGQGLHAVQDGFTHSYRTGDRTKVSVVLNYVDVVNGDFADGRDGPAHLSELDRCDNPDELRRRNRELATLASTEILYATLDTSLSKDQKMAALDTILNHYFSYEAGCNEANVWCNAPEHSLPTPNNCGCSFVGDARTQSLAGAGALFLAGVASIFGIRRLRRRGARATLVGGAALLWVAMPSTARAQGATRDPAPTSPPTTSTSKPADPANAPTVATKITPNEAEAVQKERTHRSPFALFGGGAGAFSNPGVSGMLGARFRLSDNWVVGLDGELNGWYGVHAGRLRTGALDIYASLILRFPLRYEQINLRSQLMAGTATQMLDLYGSPKGSTGLFAGLNPLGVEWKVSGHLYVIFYPLGIAVPATHLSGAPFAYPQFRTTLGLEVSF